VGVAGGAPPVRRNGISGLANVDITPNWRCAWPWPLHGHAQGRHRRRFPDTSRAARVLKQALIVGLNAAGADVIDLEVATVR